MGDPLGSSHVSSQKQNRDGVAGAQSGQYRATAEARPGLWWGPGSGCDINHFGHSVKKIVNILVKLSREWQCDHLFKGTFVKPKPPLNENINRFIAKGPN